MRERKKLLSISVFAMIFILLSSMVYAKEAKKVIVSTPGTDIDNLRVYQVMVEAYQDGDPNRDYNAGWGPSNHKGDLKGIKKALPYIKSLGFNTLWMTPIFNSDGEEKLDATGYFARNYFEVDPKFGTMQDAKDLVNEAHKLGMYVLLDGVFGHHKNGVKPSPTGLLPAGDDNPVAYPESLPFYKQVATWWIDQLEIDGWRLDQAYQVPVDAWREIRKAVETKCQQRKKTGKTWGTLGYMVAEIWKSEPQILEEGYGPEGEPALISAFDFPVRNKAVDAFTTKDAKVSLLVDAYNTHGIYPTHAHPNLMLGNHDLPRFGDLIQRGCGYGKENPMYWQRHKAAFTFFAAYTGPITMYYGEEIGDEVPNFVDPQDSGWYDDHVARTNGQISGFDNNQADLANYVRDLMKIRAEHPALWKGKRFNLLADETIYVDYKVSGKDRVLYVLNLGTKKTEEITISQAQVGGKKLKNIFDGKVIEPVDGSYTVNLEPMTGTYFVVQ